MAAWLQSNQVIRFRRKLVKFLTKLSIFVLLCGLAYLVLYPFLFKVLSSFMSDDDMRNALVNLIPMEWSLDIYRNILNDKNYTEAMWNTTWTAFLYASLTTISTSMIGYGLSKCKFKAAGVMMILVLLSMMIPIYTLEIPTFLHFRFFDVLGILEFLGIGPQNLLNTPMAYGIMSACGFSFRSGILIILMRQYYMSIPDELPEAANLDGAGPYMTFIRIIVPMAKSMMIVVFALSFAWNWTDTFYNSLLTPNTNLLPTVVALMNSFGGDVGNTQLLAITANTAALLAIVPLILFYLLLQKKIVQGIERSGLVG